VVLRGFARPNLHLSCEEIDGQKARRSATVAILREVLGGSSAPAGGAIVYAATRKNAETMGAALSDAGFRAGVYHAGMSPEDRADVNARFASGELHAVAATNAFGMGIDRSDIRVVVHLQAPGSIEAYYQEVGRAGRDGAPAEGVLLASASDMGLRKRLIDMRGSGGELAARQWDLFLDLMRYVEAGSCRHDFILRYFGDDQETLGGCGHCDVCSALEGREGSDTPEVDEAARLKVRQALSGVARARGSVGLRSVAEMLAGKSSVKSKRWGFDSLSTFGLFKDEGVEWTVALLRRLVTAALADLTSDEYPLLVLTARGVSVMKGELPADVLLPAAHAGRRSARQRAGARGSEGASKSSNELDIEALDDASRALFLALREERTALARERGVPPYVVCHDRTLLGLAVHRPTTDGGLAGVHGMGPARIESYGARLIAVIERSVGLS
jgi:ATP-dependent DNA helicase RecQ